MLFEVGTRVGKERERKYEAEKSVNYGGSKQGHWGHLCVAQMAVIETMDRSGIIYFDGGAATIHWSSNNKNKAKKQGQKQGNLKNKA